MALIKYKLGSLLELSENKNDNLEYGIGAVKGISIQKIFIETKADMTGVSLRPYYLVQPDDFAYVTVTSRNGEKITIAHNTTETTYIVSSSYVVFRIKRKDILLSDYLFMYFNRPEFDRYSRFNSWGSARETFDWSEMCDIDIELPPIEIQQKYVDIYNAMLANQRDYENGLEDLKLACDAFIEKLMKEFPHKKIGEYLILSEARNDMGLSADYVRGLAVSKVMISTKANMDGVGLNNYKIVPPDYIAYVPDTSRRGDKVSMGLNDTKDTYLVSSISTVFTTEKNTLLPEYLMMFFCRSEFDRYARFHSWGSARETFDWSEMCDVRITVRKQFQPVMFYGNDVLEIHPDWRKDNTKMMETTQNYRKVFGVTTIITDDRIPKTGLYTIDKRNLELWGQDYTAESIIDELFFSRYTTLGIVPITEND